MAQNKKFKWDIKKIVLAVLLVVVIVGVVTGKISLQQLLGISTETQTQTVITQSETQPAQTRTYEEVTVLPIGTAENEVPTTSVAAPSTTQAETAETKKQTAEYKFRNRDRLVEHYDKHGIEMGFADAKSYERAASDIINDPNVMHKYKSDGSGDQCFFVPDTNEFVVLSNDGYIRTYFICSGIKYYDRQ